MSTTVPKPSTKDDADGFSRLTWFQSVYTALSNSNVFFKKVGVPTVANIAVGTWALYKDTTGGTLKLYANDNGTIKSVTLT